MSEKKLLSYLHNYLPADIICILTLWLTASLEYMEKNLVVLDLFYTKMSYQRIDEEPAIDELTLICKLLLHNRPCKAL